MGRQSGFVTCHAALASGEADICLIPEAKFDKIKLLEHLPSAYFVQKLATMLCVIV
jgi:6-phosphofructokinase 1